MWSAIDKRVRSPHLQMLLARYATYNGSDVRRAPATLNCISHVELALGGFGVRGGMYELVRALVRVAERAGVTIRCGAPVREIVASRAGVRGVVLADGRRLESPFVVANADVSAVTKHLLPSGMPHGIREDITPSMSGFTAVVKAQRAPRVAHTVLFPEHYLKEFADIFDGDRPPVEPTVYLCAQEACHRRVGWLGHEPVFVMANAPAEPATGTREPTVWRSLEHRVMGRTFEAGLFHADDRVLWRRSPRELAMQFPGSRGAIYGSASNDSTAAFQRPANRVSGVRGLYLASGSAHPGGGVPLAALSGMAAARALEADRALRRAG
jgi:phytoene dehydrogenase-like protein